MHNHLALQFLLLLGLSLGASAQAATKEIRYDESGRLLDPLPALDVGDTLRIRVQIADPEVALQVVHQVRYTCGGTLQTAPTQDNGNDSGISKPFEDGASFDISISEECGKGVHALEWYVDVASRGDHAKRLHLHRTIRLYQSLYKVATTPEMEQREKKARGLWEELKLEYNFRKGLDQEGLNALEKVVKLIATPLLTDAFDEKDLDWAFIKKQTVGVFNNYVTQKSLTVLTPAEPTQSPDLPTADQTPSIEQPSLEPNYLQMPWTSLAHGETRIGPEVFVINRQADTLASFSTGTPSNTQQLYLAISNATEPWKLSKSVEVAQLPSDDALGTQLVATLLKLNVLGPVAALRGIESNDSDTLPEIPFVYGEPRYDVSLIRLGRFEGATQVSYTAQSSLQTEQPASISGDFVVRKARRFGVRAGLIWGQQSDTVIDIRTAANGETLYLNGQPQLELEESESTLSDQLGAILGVAFYLQPTVPGQEALAGWSSLKPYLLLGAAITEFQFTLDGLKNSLNDDLYVGFGLGAGARFGLSAGISVAPRKEAVLNNDGTAWELDERYGRTGFFVSLNADLQMARAFLGVRDSLNLGLQDNAETANGVE